MTTTTYVVLTPEELHESMMAYAKKISATRESARAFLKEIGVPLRSEKEKKMNDLEKQELSCFLEKEILPIDCKDFERILNVRAEIFEIIEHVELSGEELTFDNCMKIYARYYKTNNDPMWNVEPE